MTVRQGFKAKGEERREDRVKATDASTRAAPKSRTTAPDPAVKRDATVNGRRFGEQAERPTKPGSPGHVDVRQPARNR